MGDREKIETVLKEVETQTKKGARPTTKEIEIKVAKLTPRERKARKPATGKAKGKGKKAKEIPVYKPTAAEQDAL